MKSVGEIVARVSCRAFVGLPACESRSHSCIPHFDVELYRQRPGLSGNQYAIHHRGSHNWYVGVIPTRSLESVCALYVFAIISLIGAIGLQSSGLADCLDWCIVPKIFCAQQLKNACSTRLNQMTGVLNLTTCCSGLLMLQRARSGVSKDLPCVYSSSHLLLYTLHRWFVSSISISLLVLLMYICTTELRIRPTSPRCKSSVYATSARRGGNGLE